MSSGDYTVETEMAVTQSEFDRDVSNYRYSNSEYEYEYSKFIVLEHKYRVWVVSMEFCTIDSYSKWGNKT